MALRWKEIRRIGRSAYVYYPDIPNRTAYKVASVTVVREERSRESVERLLAGGLERLACEKKLILCFPNPEEGGWRWQGGAGTEADLEALCTFQDELAHVNDQPMELNAKGIPTYEAMMSTWHPMNDTKYVVGIGAGGSMAAVLAAQRPWYVPAVYLQGAELTECVRRQAMGAAVPAWLDGCSAEVEAYFLCANEIDGSACGAVRVNKRNPSQRVILEAGQGEAAHVPWERMWEELFCITRRMNTCQCGDCCDRTDLQDPGFTWFVDDDRIDGRPHTWLVHVPSSVQSDGAKRVPIVFFYHGGSDNPAEAAEMSRFHEVGEREGFLTVYPWGTNRASWNMELEPGQEDDLAFCRALILYMIEHYPADPSRVYLSGFSNGAGMAQTVAMVYPELVAALGHIDSNWPGTRSGFSEVDYQKVEPMRIALEKKKTFDYRMPVWYTYGTREVSSPVYRGCTQQHQYDFWKLYNHIPVKETPARQDPALPEHGVDGDVSEVLRPDERYPAQYYTVQRFFSDDPVPQNLYNFALMHHKGHEVATGDAWLAWEYLKQYRRNEDGTVGRV